METEFVRPIESIDSRHIMSVILFLHENGPSRKTDIYQQVCRNGNMPTKFRQMIECGIMTEKSIGNITTFDLTESGRKIAKHLKSIESLLTRGL